MLVVLDGTADVIKQGGTPSQPTFARVARLNIIPDIQERMAEIQSSPDRLAFFLAIRQAVGEGHDQFVDDMFTDPGGTEVYVSRPSFADVVAIDLGTGEIRWRFPMDGYRSDHMAISPDGTQVLVSDSTTNVVHRIDLATGEERALTPLGFPIEHPEWAPDSGTGSEAAHSAWVSTTTFVPAMPGSPPSISARPTKTKRATF